MTVSADFRLTQYATGGGCACKIPPGGELEQVVAPMLAAPRWPRASPRCSGSTPTCSSGWSAGGDLAVRA